MDKNQNSLSIAEEIAEELRQEPYSLLLPKPNNCLTKSIRFIRECQRRNIDAQLVWCVFGLVEAKLPLIGSRTVPSIFHFRPEVEGKRFEVSRPLEATGHFDIKPADIKPIITLGISGKLFGI